MSVRNTDVRAVIVRVARVGDPETPINILEVKEETLIEPARSLQHITTEIPEGARQPVYSRDPPSVCLWATQRGRFTRSKGSLEAFSLPFPP